MLVNFLLYSPYAYTRSSPDVQRKHSKAQTRVFHPNARRIRAARHEPAADRSLAEEASLQRDSVAGALDRM